MQMVMLLKLTLLCCCCAMLTPRRLIATAAPIAPATPDGAVPIAAQVNAEEFGNIDELTDQPEVAESTHAHTHTQTQTQSLETQEAQAQPEAGQQKSASTDVAFKISLLPMPEKTAESVNLEYEGVPSKILTAYDNSQKKLIEVTHPISILDSIGEHEKYGNNGDMFDGISRSIVNGYEAFSNLLNTFIQKPKEFARTISKGITAQLDIIGGKLVGL